MQTKKPIKTDTNVVEELMHNERKKWFFPLNEDQRKMLDAALAEKRYPAPGPEFFASYRDNDLARLTL